MSARRIKEKTVITFETRRRTIVHGARRSEIVCRCEQCGAETQMLTPEEAAEFCQTSVRAIYRQIESGKLHFLETDAGALLVCRKSLESEF